MKRLQRIIALLLTAAMMTSYVPVGALAASESEPTADILEMTGAQSPDSVLDILSAEVLSAEDAAAEVPSAEDAAAEVPSAEDAAAEVPSAEDAAAEVPSADNESAEVLSEEAAAPETDGEFTYLPGADGTALLQDYTGKDLWVEIPDTLGGYEVTVLGTGVFEGDQDLRALLLPDTLQQVESGAFGGCKNLELLCFLGDEPLLGASVAADSGLCHVVTPESADYTILKELLTADLSETASVQYETFRSARTLTEKFREEAEKANHPAGPSDDAPQTSGALPEEPQISGTQTGEPQISGTQTEEHQTSAAQPQAVTEGTLGDNLTWRLDADGTFHVIGAGPMQEVNPMPWEALRPEIKKLDLDDRITSICSAAFANCENLTGELKLPSGLTRVGFMAFSECSGLTGTLVLPESLEMVGGMSFLACSGLTGELRIPDGTAVNSDSFGLCTGITALSLGNGDLYIPAPDQGPHPFRGMTGVTRVTFRTSRWAFGSDNPIEPLTGLTEMVVPQTEVNAYWETFTPRLPAGASLMTDGPYPDFGLNGTTLVGYCGTDFYVTIPGEVTAIGAGAFRGRTTLETVELPSGLESIGHGAFEGCTGLMQLTCPDSYELPAALHTIESRAFAGCTGLTEVNMSENVRNLGTCVFEGDAALTRLSLGAISSFRGDELKGMTGLKNLRFATKEVPAFSPELFQTLTALETVDVPEESYFLYTEAMKPYLPQGCRMRSLAHPDFVRSADRTVILAYTGEGGYVSLTDGITAIGENAFRDRTDITYVDLSRGMLTEIGPNAFRGCTGLTGELVLPDSLSRVGAGAFNGCSGVTAVTFGRNGSIQIAADPAKPEDHAFGGMTGVETVTFRSEHCPKPQPTQAEADLLAFMPGLMTIRVPSLGLEHYQQVLQTALPNVTLEAYELYSDFQIQAGVLTAYLGSDRYVELPPEVREIGPSAFESNQTICQVTAGSPIRRIGERAFMGCTAYEGIMDIISGAESIGAEAFSGCTALKGNLILAATEIGPEAFRGCTGLTGSLKLKGEKTVLGRDAFLGCGFTGNLFLADCTPEPGGTNGLSGITSLTLGRTFRSLDAGAPTEGAAHPFAGLTGVKTIHFLGTTPPVCTAQSLQAGPFASMTALESVTVPGEALSAYRNALTPCLPAGVRMETFGPSGEGFRVENGVLTGYTGAGGSLVLPDTVTEIAADAFRNNLTITSVLLPDHRIALGDHAFAGCTALEQVLSRQNSGFTTLGVGAFEDCTALQEVQTDLGGNLSEALFRNCASLTSLGAGPVTGLGAFTFQGCTALQNVNLAQSLEIPEGAFDGCTNLMSLGEGFRLQSAGPRAFRNCRKLRQITLSSGPIGESAFENCEQLSGFLELVSTHQVRDIGPRAFKNCISLEEVYLENDMNAIGAEAFAGCTGLMYVTMPHSLNTLGEGAFAECTGISGWLKIPDRLRVIPADAFRSLSGITEIKMGADVEQIHCGETDHAFAGMAGVETLEFTGSAVPQCLPQGSDPYRDMAGLTTIEVPYPVLDAFRQQLPAPQGAAYRSIDNGFQVENGVLVAYHGYEPTVMIPDYVTVIGDNAFHGNGNIASVTFPRNLTEIRTGAFRNCVNLSRLRLPASLKVIGSGAFQNCGKLTGSLVIPAGVTKIGDSAFEATGLTSVKLPAGLTELGAACFSDSRLTGKLALPRGLRKIWALAFMNCSGLTSVELPDGVETIGANAFMNCGLQGELRLPDGLTELGDLAFAGNQLTGVSLPAAPYVLSAMAELYGPFCKNPQLKTVTFRGSFSAPGGENALLKNLPALQTVYAPGAELSRYAEYFFETLNPTVQFAASDGSDGLTVLDGVLCAYRGSADTLVIPDTVTAIGSGVFHGHGELTRVTLPAGLRSVGAAAFRGCGLTGTLTLPDPVETVGASAFLKSGFTEITFGKALTGLGDKAFGDMTALKRINFRSAAVPTLSGQPFAGSTCTTVCVPAAAYDSYRELLKLPETTALISPIDGQTVTGARVTHAYSRTAALAWDPMDCEDVLGYQVLDDSGKIVGETADCRIALDVGAVGPFRYTVRAYGGCGRVSRSCEVSGRTAYPQVLLVKTETQDNRISVEFPRITAELVNTGNLRSLGERRTTAVFSLRNADGTVHPDYSVLASTVLEEAPDTGSAVWTVNLADTVLNDLVDGRYRLVCTLTDADGVSNEKSIPVTVALHRPQPIAQLVAVSGVDRIALNWTISAEVNSDIYQIYRRVLGADHFDLVHEIRDRKTLSWADTDVVKDTVYEYYVCIQNSYGSVSLPSEIVSAKLAPDVERPQVTKVTPPADSFLRAEAAITAEILDNLGVQEAQLWISRDNQQTWEQLMPMTPTTPDDQTPPVFTARVDTVPMADGPIHLRVTAKDAAGNESDGFTVRYQVDNTGPQKVTGLASLVTDQSVTLSWADVPDQDRGIFLVEQKEPDGSFREIREVHDTLGVNILELTPDTEYTFRVSAFDLAGNRGVPSDEYVVRTAPDTDGPVVTRLLPGEGYYASVLNLSAEIRDPSGIASAGLQVSVDRINWTDVHTETCPEPQKTVNLTFALDLAPYAEGDLYFRAVARDRWGNSCDIGDKAPYVQYRVDRTAPAVPRNLTAQSVGGAVKLAWTQGTEEDLDCYTIYRSETENGEFLPIRKNLRAVSFIDTDVVREKIYYYKLAVDDLAGNLSPMTQAASVRVEADTEAPVIRGIYPADGGMLGGDIRSISFLAADNSSVGSMVLAWRNEAGEFVEFGRNDDLVPLKKELTAALPAELLTGGAAVVVRATVTDAAGHTVERTASYTVDMTAPNVENVTAALEGNGITVRWTGFDEPDIAGYRIYRAEAGRENVHLMGQIPAVKGQTAYSITDNGISGGKITYVYRVDAVDLVGNIASVSAAPLELGDRSAPVAMIRCDPVFEQGVEYYVDGTGSYDNSAVVSYAWDFGDGTASTEDRPVHVYQDLGTYVITLTVTDDDGHTATAKQTVTVRERSLVGEARITVVDEDGNPVSDASVYFDFGQQDQTVKKTAYDGTVSFTADIGMHEVGCILADNNWLPAKKTVMLRAGSTNDIKLVMVRHTLVEGKFDVTRMTMEEIRAAGIDVTRPENQHIIKINVRMKYGPFDPEQDLLYNPSTGELTGESHFPEFDRNLFPFLIIFSGGTHKWHGGSEYNPLPNPFPDDDEEKEYKPLPDLEQAVLAVLDVPISASYLKEFFDVKLHIINNSSTDFSMLDSTVKLNLPEGLTLINADTLGTEVRIPEIPGQTTKTLSWILRGDVKGSYNLSADYTGMLSGFEVPIKARFAAQEPLQVFGLDAVQLIAEINSYISRDSFYFNLAIENTSDADVYLPSISVENDIISSYVALVKEMNAENFNPDRMYPDVTRYNSTLETAAHFSRPLGPNPDIQRLAPGEKLKNMYVVYNVMNENELWMLREAVAQVSQGYGINFRIEKTDMNLYDMSYPQEKVRDMMTDPTRKDMYDHLTNLDRYAYIMRATDYNDSILGNIGLGLYDAGKAIFGFDLHSNKDKMRAITRTIVYKLMTDATMAQMVNANVDTKYLEIVGALTDHTAKMLDSEIGVDGGDQAAWDEFAKVLKTTECNRELAEVMRGGGYTAFQDRLINEIEALTLSSAAKIDMILIVESDGLLSCFTEVYSKVNGSMNSVISTISDVVGAWNDAADLTNEIMNLSAAQDEIKFLIDNLQFSIGSVDEVVADELNQIYKKILDKENLLKKQFCENLMGVVGGAVGKEALKQTLKLLGEVFGMKLNFWYAVAGAAFNSADYAFDWGTTVENNFTLRVIMAFSIAIRDSLTSRSIPGAAAAYDTDTLRLIKYLVRIHLVGECSYGEIMEMEDIKEQEKDLAIVNRKLKTKYSSISEYVTASLEQLQTYRDGIFASYHEDVSIPAAPAVRLDYRNQRTVDAYGPEMEYSFSGTEWFPCTGEPIPAIPSDVGRHLWVRVRGTASGPAGNITKILIPARPRIMGDIRVIFTGRQYEITGLAAGTYLYAFADTEGNASPSVTVHAGQEGRFRIQDSGSHRYLVLGRPVSDTAFASQLRYVAVQPAENAWVVDENAGIVSGVFESTLAKDIVAHYEKQGHTASVTAPNGQPVEMAGTGCVLHLDGKAYDVVVAGDVDGDAGVNVFDLYAMLSHVNSVKTLEGAYLKAGQVTGNQNVSVYDIFAELRYVNTGDFAS